MPQHRTISVPNVVIPSNISCSKLFDGDKSEVRRIPSELSGYVKIDDDRKQSKWLLNQTQHCNIFHKERLYITSNASISQEEKDFPIAYSMLVYKNPMQVENLLRAIYRPHNFYCIHVDSNAKDDYKRAIRNLTDCFPNVFVPSNCTKVVWGQWGVLEGEMICMRELVKRSKHWKYFINLTGQEFPLRTNLEIVRILKSLNGSNDVEHEDMCRTCPERWKNSYNNSRVIGKKEPPPHEIKIYKGSTHVLLAREFVDFILADRRVKDFYDWLKDTSIPEETFIPTIQFNPHLRAPGTYTGQ
ncbi:hypothetical protein CAPTEDRAFT_121102 [Capitella teleta]|uniref:Protein xylosyltransferase n=1 Tax=Capitella teleta TaxID=283909 RepID=R7V998_CAPTE|nr:hypothetical protein CAPTEDRAFT_121102 [Capitella teleta]|eukprot:ELU15423.1 hypothetical protein CAPTEDRAFT_121102 [Capitella teleta]